MIRTAIITAILLMAPWPSQAAVDAHGDLVRYDPARPLTGHWVLILMPSGGMRSFTREFDLKDDCQRALVEIKVDNPRAIAGCFER